MNTRRSGYEDAIVTVPVTVPYVRYSLHGAHWFVARALKGLLEGSGLKKTDIDGLCLSSFTLAPDSAVGLIDVTLRAEMQRWGVRVINIFPGPIDDEWNQTLPPPKLSPDALARASVKALQEGIEDVYPGDMAQEWLARWRENPKVFERELAANSLGHPSV